MYDINTRNIKKGFVSYSIFLVVGIFFLVVFGGIFISDVNTYNELDSHVMSIGVRVSDYLSTDGTTMYRPTYFYEVDGIQYSCTSSSSSSTYPGDKNVKVYYDSKNPAKCMTEYSKSSNLLLLIFLLIPILCIGIAIWNFVLIFRRLKAVKQLNKTGKLVKGLPYDLEHSGLVIMGHAIMRPVVDYTLSSGSVITLIGDARHDRKSYDADGKVDLVIDENNPNNYFIDFEINRLSGNLPQDYSNYSQENNSNQEDYNTEYNQNNF